MARAEKTYPDRTLENALQERGIPFRCMWETKGPSNTGIAWITGFLIRDRMVIVQTNREFFKVIDKKGKQTLIVQEVEQISANTGNEPAMTGKSLPGEAFTKNSKPYTIRVSHGNHVKIEGHYASVWDGLPVSWTDRKSVV